MGEGEMSFIARIMGKQTPQEPSEGAFNMPSQPEPEKLTFGAPPKTQAYEYHGALYKSAADVVRAQAIDAISSALPLRSYSGSSSTYGAPRYGGTQSFGFDPPMYSSYSGISVHDIIENADKLIAILTEYKRAMAEAESRNTHSQTGPSDSQTQPSTEGDQTP
jgi:hypothetical protein